MDDHLYADDPWGSRHPSLLTTVYIGGLKHLARGALKRPLRKALRPHIGVIDVNLDGIKMRCRMGDNFTDNAIIEGRIGGDLKHILRITRDLRPGDVFVDVGANCGVYTMFAARKVGGTGRVIAIEPIPKMAQRIQFNANANYFSQVKVSQTAVRCCRWHVDAVCQHKAIWNIEHQCL